MPPDGTPVVRPDDERRRALERIVFAKGDAAEIERAARELEALRRAQATVAEPGPTPAGSDAPRSGVAAVRVGSEAPALISSLRQAQGPSLTVAEPVEAPDPVAEPTTLPSRPKPLVLAAFALGILAGGIAIGSVISSSALDDQTRVAADGTLVNGDPFISGDPLPSPAPGAATAFIDINTGQVVGYGGVEPAAALEIFDREQTDADRPAFPLAADLQPSTTRLLEMAGSAAIYAAMDTLARPCLVVVGENQYSATCQTDFEFPKAGIRLSWAPSVAQATTLSESGRRSPVVYTAVWLPDGAIEVGALVQGS